jgi:hypothetical protein
MSQLRAMWSPGGTVLAILLLCVRPALGECILTRELSYQLKSDTVDWRMQISSGQSCVRGLRHGRVTIDSEAHFCSAIRTGEIARLRVFLHS